MTDLCVGEKAAAWALTNVMKARSKFCGGIRKKKNKKRKIRKCLKRCYKRGKALSLKPYRKVGGGKKSEDN